MKLFALFTNKAPTKVFLSVVLGIVAGISYATLIPVVLLSIGSKIDQNAANSEMTRTFLTLEVSNYKFALLFVSICIFILICRTTSHMLLARVALDATTELRIKMYRQIMNAPIAELEKMGSSKLIVAITTDVARIVMGASLVPNVLVNLVTMAGMLGYLFLLSSDIFWFTVGAIVFGVITYQIPMYIGRRYFQRGRAKMDVLQESIRGLIQGTKELKLSKVKRDRYFNEVLIASEYDVLNNSKTASTIVSAAANYGDLLGFFVIGVVTYIFVSYHSISTESLVGAIMSLLYVTGPVAALLFAMVPLSNAKVSYKSMKAVFDALSTEQARQEIQKLPEWDSIRFSNVTYHYDDSDNTFVLGPVDLEFAKGEITFIVGGNGSGKSTLCKLMALHYAPTAGEIHFGKVKMDPQSLNSGREYISAILSDYYLFDRLLGSLSEVDETMVNRYLTKLEIDRKVSVKDGKFSTLALSDGQKKRLALVVAFLEDRDIYLFDEWAADQDPVFKQVFYHTIVPELKARNKAVVVITHDDRYFHVADQVLFMEEGKLIRTEHPSWEVKEPLVSATTN